MKTEEIKHAVIVCDWVYYLGQMNNKAIEVSGWSLVMQFDNMDENKTEPGNMQTKTKNTW